MLHGKTALVTGSSQGIGRAVAEAFVRAGAKVVSTAEQPQPPGGVPAGTTYIPANLLREGAAAELVRQAVAVLGPIDILVNNLGTYREPPFSELTYAHFAEIFRLNVWTGLELAQALVRENRPSGRGGRIVFSTSLNATRSEPWHTLYDASKGAINALTRQLAIELAPAGFTTIAIAPGLVETPLTDFGLRSDPAARQAVLDQIPLRRIATVADLAPWYVFAASDAAAYATGTVLTVDGGLDAQQMPSRPVIAAEQGLPLSTGES
ncbi:MAG: SDR family NAD(P)-dependent oxidoreductase [Gemmataceae bacterium]